MTSGAGPDPATFLSAARPDRDARRATGMQRRAQLPLEALAAVPRGGRRDPVSLLRDQEVGREADLLPLRYQRMSSDPFAFLRGAAAVMASDLSLFPHSGLLTQLCGDAHLANFGLFATSERRLLFDLNDFDETLQGPFEWDVKRLAASVVVCGRNLGLSDKKARRAARDGARTYRETMAKLSDLPALAAWRVRVDATDLHQQLRHGRLGKVLRKAQATSRRRDSNSATLKLTEDVNGLRRFRCEPPLLVPVPDGERESVVADLTAAYGDYLQTIPIDLIALLAKFAFTDLARKVVGVGSVGTRALVLLLESGDGEPLVLQLKQAGTSVLEPYLEPSPFAHAGRRVVSGQKAMQAAGDPFLGWCRGGTRAPYDFYVRQLHDQKASIDLTRLDAKSLSDYASLCGGVLARAHARVGDASAISGYLGSDKAFDTAIADFALGYADITAEDHAELVRYRTTGEKQ